MRSTQWAVGGLFAGVSRDSSQGAPCRQQTHRAMSVLYSRLLLSELLRTYVHATSGVVRDSLVDMLAELWLTCWMHLGLMLYVWVSEAHVNIQKQSFFLWT